MNKQTIVQRWLTALGLMLALALTAGCGDDADGNGDPPPEADTIPEVAVDAGNFTTLVALLDSADLVGTLSGAGPFTVFAPSDDAFDAFEAENPGVLDSLSPEQVEAVLLYHVVDGEYRSSALSAGMMLETLLTPQTVEIGSNGNLTVNGIDIVTADIEASNGVIHVIDGVLIPPGIVETALAAGSFNTLAALVQQADLVEVLQGSGPFTVFAPTDEAFEAFEAENPGVLESLTPEQVSNVLRYHVVSGQVLSSDLSDGQEVETLEDSGETVTIGVGETVTVNDAQVVTADIRTFNGVIHVIDDVLVPTNP
jgi:transforming growth factor-beta-induced protein